MGPPHVESPAPEALAGAARGLPIDTWFGDQAAACVSDRTRGYRPASWTPRRSSPGPRGGLAPVHPAGGWERGAAGGDREGEGTTLYDTDGNAYIDGVSSLWCNVHGHRHPAIDAAIRDQLDRVAHTTMLGLAHPPAIELARRLRRSRPPGLTRVFYSDNGSTAVEVALKMAFQWWRPQRASQRPGSSASQRATTATRSASVSVGGIDIFHPLYRPLLFDAWQAEPRRRRRPGARCSSEHARARRRRDPRAAGAGRGRHARAPRGYLRAVRELCDAHGVLLICDEVATGFGRTGGCSPASTRASRPICVLAKGLTGGYLPLAATLTTERIYEGFLGALRGVQDLLPRPHLHGQPARLRGGARHPRRVRAEQTLQRLAAEDRAAGRAGSTSTSRRCPRSPRSAAAGYVRHRARGLPARGADRPPGDARGPPARRVIRPLGDVVVLMPPLSIERGRAAPAGRDHRRGDRRGDGSRRPPRRCLKPGRSARNASRVRTRQGAAAGRRSAERGDARRRRSS